MKCAADNKSLIQSIREQERELATKVFMIWTATSAFDKCGLCENTVAKLLDGIMYYADSMNRDYIDIKDLQDALKNEHGFEIEFYKRGR